MSMITEKKFAVFSMYVVAVGILTACGGGGGDSAAPAPAPSGQYSVGGSVAGLQGPVSLKNNGADTLQVSSANSYTFATTLAQSANYSVTADVQPGQNCVVSNGSGIIAAANVTSANVACAVKSWVPSSQPLETDDNPVRLFNAGIDDQGNVTALFVKSNGTRPVLYATRGKPSAAGTAPVWEPPVPLDGVGSEFNLPASFVANNLSLAVSPNGNAHAVWIHAEACTAQTYNPFSNNVCKYIYSSRYVTTTGVWDTPVRLGDTPSGGTITAANATMFQPIARVNDRGDTAVFYAGWTRSGTVSYIINPSIGWRSAGQLAFQSRRFDDLTSYLTSFLPFDVTLDNSGGMVLAGHQLQAGSTNKDVVAYVGNLTSGFDAQRTTVDQRGVDAQFIDVAAAPSGEVAITWHQNNGVVDTYYSAVKKSTASPWAVDELGVASSADATHLVMTGSADALLYVNCGVYKWNKVSAQWATLKALPSTCGWFSSGFTGFSDNGSYLFVSLTTGLWTTYDIGTNAMIHPMPSTTPVATDYVLGVAGQGSQTGIFGFGSTGVALLAPNGLAAYVGKADFDTLPTAAQPNGDGRENVTNLWGFYLK